MYINYQTKRELRERPEQDLNQLAAFFLNKSAYWDKIGIYGIATEKKTKRLLHEYKLLVL